MIVFIVVVGYGNRHPWYQLPLVPIAAALAGSALANLNALLSRQRLIYGTIALVVLGGFAVQAFVATRYLYRPVTAGLRNLGLALKNQTPLGSLVIVVDYGDPTALYYGERKGWHFAEKDAIYNGHPVTSADAIADLEHLRQQGATHIAFYSESVWWFKVYPEFAQYLTKNSKRIANTPDNQIFELHR